MGSLCAFIQCVTLYIYNLGFTRAPSPTAVCSRWENSKSVYTAGGTKTQGKGEHSIGLDFFKLEHCDFLEKGFVENAFKQMKCIRLCLELIVNLFICFSTFCKTTVFKIYIVLDWVRSGGFEKKIGPKWRRKISSSKPGKQNLKKDITALLLKILC